MHGAVIAWPDHAGDEWRENLDQDLSRSPPTLVTQQESKAASAEADWPAIAQAGAPRQLWPCNVSRWQYSCACTFHLHLVSRAIKFQIYLGLIVLTTSTSASPIHLALHSVPRHQIRNERCRTLH